MTTTELARLKSFRKRKSLIEQIKLTPVALLAIAVCITVGPVIVSDYFSAKTYESDAKRVLQVSYE